MKITKKIKKTARRRASREIELENSTGFVSTHKVHKSVKVYSRKKKHKDNLDGDE